MSAFVQSGGNIRNMKLDDDTIEKVAKALGIAASEIKQGTKIQVTLSTPGARKSAAKKGRGRQGK
jgi:hypothetical protein